MGSIFLGAYWAARKENIESCAKRLSSFLAQCGYVHPELCTWFKKAARRKATNIQIEINENSIRKLLKIIS